MKSLDHLLTYIASGGALIQLCFSLGPLGSSPGSNVMQMLWGVGFPTLPQFLGVKRSKVFI